MGKTAPLPLQSCSLAELQGNAKLGDVSKYKIKTLCESSGKIFKEALVQKDLRDEEKAYMLFFKYVDCVQKIRKNPEFKKDECYYTSMYNIQKNSKKAIDDLEVLATSLERRYEDKENAASSEGKKVDKVAGKEGRINAGKLLDVNSNEDSPAPLVNGVKEHQAEDIITYQRLFSLINEKSTTFFVLDTRSAEVVFFFYRISFWLCCIVVCVRPEVIILLCAGLPTVPHQPPSVPERAGDDSEAGEHGQHDRAGAEYRAPVPVGQKDQHRPPHHL